METKPTIGQEGPTFEEIAIIEKATNGLIKTYEWWVVKGISGSFETTQKPSYEEDIIFHGKLNDSFVSKLGHYIGDFKHAQWYKKNGLKVYEPYPHGVAIVMDQKNPNEIEGYYGYSHRGGSIFKIGDRIFDKNYKPKQEDYTLDQWESWVKTYNHEVKKAEDENNTWWLEDIKRDGIARYIPFKFRGNKIVETLDDAIIAAINLSKYLG